MRKSLHLIKKHEMLKLRFLSPPALLLLVLVYWWHSLPMPNRGNIQSVEPAQIITAAATLEFTEDDFTQHVNALKKRLPSPEFSVVVQRPFVVIGDESAQVVQQRARDTVKWAVDRLKQDFFPKDPEEILDIWLFK